MVPLLSLDGVSKRFSRGGPHGRQRIALRNVSLEIEPAELAVVWGRRGSGRTTLLEVAAGVVSPDDGVVQFDGYDLARHPMLGAPAGISYCTTRFAEIAGDSVLDQVAMPLLNGRRHVLPAQARAHEALRRVDATTCAELQPEDLNATETVRVALARALITEPRLLLIDTPTHGVPPAGTRDQLLELLRSLARRDGIAVLMTVDEASDMAGADCAFTIDSGEVRGERPRGGATVVQLREARPS